MSYPKHELESDQDYVFRLLNEIRLVIVDNKVKRLAELNVDDVFQFTDDSSKTYVARSEPYLCEDTWSIDALVINKQ